MRKLEENTWWPELVAKKDDLSLRQLSEMFGTTPSAIQAALLRNGLSRSYRPAGAAPLSSDASLIDGDTEHALTPPAEIPLWMSQGQTFRPHEVGQEVRMYSGRMVRAAVEIGRRLAWAKQALAHGEFGAWCEEYVSFGRSTAHRYMTLAKRFQKHPKLLEQLGNVSMQKALEVAAMDEDELRQFEADGQFGGIEVERIEDLSYSELRKELAVERKKRAAQEDLATVNAERAERAERKQQDLRDQLTMARGGNLTDAELAEQLESSLDDLEQRFQAHLLTLHNTLQLVGDKKDSLPPLLVGKAQAALALHESTLTAVRFRFTESVGGEFVPQGAFDDLEDDLNRHGRKLPYSLRSSLSSEYDDDDDSESGT